MADSYVTHTGNGTAGPFSFSALDYLSVDHLVVKVDGVTKTLTTHYTVAAPNVTFTSGNFPASDAVIKIQRDTPRTKATRVVDFADGAVLTEADLDNAHLQNLYIAQESFENTSTSLVYDESLGAYTADSKEIKVLADPTTDASAVHRKYVTDVATFGVPAVPQQHNEELDGSTTIVTLSGWTGVSQNMIVVTLDGVLQVPGTDFTAAAAGSDTTLTLIGSPAPADGTVLNVQNFGVAKSYATLGTGSVDSDQIVSGAVDLGHLNQTGGSEAVGTAAIRDGAVTSAKIADDSVDFARLKDTAFIDAPGGSADHGLMIARGTGNISTRALVVADVSDFNDALNARAVSSFGEAEGNLVMGDGTTNYKITRLQDGTALTDAVNLKQLNDKTVGAAAVINGPSLTCTTSYQNLGLTAFQTEYDPDGVISVDTSADTVALASGVWRMDGHLSAASTDSNEATLRYKVVEVGGSSATFFPETTLPLQDDNNTIQSATAHFSAVINASSAAVTLKIEVKEATGSSENAQVNAAGSCITFQRIA